MANDYPSTPPFNYIYLTARIDDISTADQVYVAPGIRCEIKRIISSLGGAITVADADLTAKIGGTAVTNGVITVTASGSAAGDVDTATPTAANTCEKTQSIEIETDGASTDAAEVLITLELKPV